MKLYQHNFYAKNGASQSDAETKFYQQDESKSCNNEYWDCNSYPVEIVPTKKRKAKSWLHMEFVIFSDGRHFLKAHTLDGKSHAVGGWRISEHPIMLSLLEAEEAGLITLT